jgi:hypothetical protein
MLLEVFPGVPVTAEKSRRFAWKNYQGIHRIRVMRVSRCSKPYRNAEK